MNVTQFNPLLFEDEHLVRQTEEADELWFVAADICRVLGIKNVSQAVENLDEDEKGLCSTYTLGGQQEVLMVTEGGLYTLILRSRLAMTPGTIQHRFRKWVTRDVIPTIRRTGSFNATKAVGDHGAMEEPKENDGLKLRKVDSCRQIFGPQAAGQLWFKLGLDDVPAMHLDPRQITIWDYSTIKTTEAAE